MKNKVLKTILSVSIIAILVCLSVVQFKNMIKVVAVQATFDDVCNYVHEITNQNFYTYEQGTIAAATGDERNDPADLNTRFRLVERTEIDTSWKTLEFSSLEKDIRITIFAYDENGKFLSPSSGWIELTKPYTYSIKQGTKKISYAISYITEKPILTTTRKTWLSIKNSDKSSVDLRCRYKLNAHKIAPEYTLTGTPGVQGGNFVDGNLWLTTKDSTDGHLLTDGIVKIYSVNYDTLATTEIHQFTHNFGHMNSYSYDSNKRELIMGNGSGSYTQLPEFFVIKIDKINLDGSNTLASVGAKRFSVPANFGFKCNVIWTDEKNVAIMLTNDGITIRKIKLATGTTKFKYGTYSSAGADEYNGTWDVLETYNILEPFDVVQGAIWINGKLVIGLGHGPLAIAVINLLDGGFMDYTIHKDTSIAKTAFTVFYDKKNELWGGNFNGNSYLWSDTNFTLTGINPNPRYGFLNDVNDHVSGKGTSLAFYVKKDYKLLKNVEVDNQLLDSIYYTVKEGSTIVTLLPSYLNKLSVGEHTLKLTYTDNVGVSNKFIILAKESTIPPDASEPETEDTDSKPKHGFLDDVSDHVLSKETPLAFYVIKDNKLLKNVEVDNQLLDSIYYTVNEGNTIVTLLPSYLNKLPVGEHTLELIYTDNTSVSSKFTVLAKEPIVPSDGSTSKTGVIFVTLMIISTLISITGIAILLIKTKKTPMINKID